MIYHVEYDGYYTMRFHDDEPNALKRWFDNYKIEHDASFATKYEWLVVKEVASDNKKYKTRFICEIGDDGRGTRREVIMDHTTPPAPMLTFAAKLRYEPPPAKTAQQIWQEIKWNMREEIEWNMLASGYVPIRRAVIPPMPVPTEFDHAVKDSLEYKHKIEWVLKTQNYFLEPDFNKERKPKAPTHRRNV